MGNTPEKDDSSDFEESEKNAERVDHIVRVTVDFMRVAERVLEEYHGSDAPFEGAVTEGDEDDGPSVMEISCIAQMIMSGSMAGIYKTPERNEKSTVQQIFEMIEPLLESKVSLAVSKARLATQKMTAMPIPMPMVPSAPWKSAYETAMEAMQKDTENCECFKLGKPICPECEKREAVTKTMLLYMKKQL